MISFDTKRARDTTQGMIISHVDDFTSLNTSSSNCYFQKLIIFDIIQGKKSLHVLKDFEHQPVSFFLNASKNFGSFSHFTWKLFINIITLLSTCSYEHTHKTFTYIHSIK